MLRGEINEIWSFPILDVLVIRLRADIPQTGHFTYGIISGENGDI